jgi:hypothetical protein
VYSVVFFNRVVYGKTDQLQLSPAHCSYTVKNVENGGVHLKN